MRTDRQILGDLGEAFVAKELRETGFEVKLIGGNFPGYDILASRLSVGTDIRIQVKTWGEGINDKPLAKTHRLHLADVYVLVRGDDLSNLEPYVFLADEIAEARQISEIPPDFPFTRDPGTKNPAGVGYWARKHWLFCHPRPPERLASGPSLPHGSGRSHACKAAIKLRRKATHHNQTFASYSRTRGAKWRSRTKTRWPL